MATPAPHAPARGLRLVVTEKPSVARDLARVLGVRGRGDGYLHGEGLVLTWCRGHLLEHEEPGAYDPAWKPWRLDTLPMVPPAFALRVRKGAEDQWAVVQRLLRDDRFGTVVNACDAGREGELIFRQVYEHAGVDTPVLRLWTSSLTDQAIRAAWSRLEPGARFDPLGDAARSRSEADWLVGYNATRALTCRTRQAGGDALWSVGRVQTPTLAMIVERDAAIEAFVPEPFWRVKAEVGAAGGAWTAWWFDPSARDDKVARGEAPRAERLPTQEAADRVAAALAGREGVVAEARRRTRTEAPPLLYDLTALQRRANQRYGMSAQRTLEIAQALYEKHKVLTYPRTDARHLTSDQVDTLPGVLRAVGGLGPYRDTVDALLGRSLRITRRLVDDDEVGDHHAILPTDRTPDAGRLSPEEKRVYDLVARRLLAALSPDAVIDLTDLVVTVPTDAPLPEGQAPPVHLRAKGRILREAGWQAIDPPSRRRDVELPAVEVGDAVRVVEAEVQEGATRPPRPHDDASILQAMETAGRALDDAQLARALRASGLGTPATRASILQTLLDRKYVVRDGKTLRSTTHGRALVEAVPVEELKSAELTGRWELRLMRIAEGAESRERFMADVVARLDAMVEAFRATDLPEAATLRTRPAKPSLGPCPVCGEPVRRRGPVWTCDSGLDCPFLVYETMSSRKISERMVRSLIKDGRTPSVKGFKSRQGKPFEAGLAVQDTGRVRFWFPDRDDRSGGAGGREDRSGGAAGGGDVRDRRRAAARSAGVRIGDPCPTCGEGRVFAGRTRLGCSRWREGCAWRGPLLADEPGRQGGG